MTRYVNRVVLVSLVVAIAGAPGVAVASPVDGAGDVQPRVSDPCSDLGPGAASPEPPQSLVDPEEVETSAAHARWMEGIWTGP